jgi:L-threonylcarbamoyladenylate synthase
MQVTSVHPVDPKPSRVAVAVEVLRAGGVVAIPTETFYGLAVDASQPEALAKLNRIKRKEVDSPSLLLASDVGQISAVAEIPEGPFEALAEAFWPGPLTLVLRAVAGLPPEVGGAGESRGTVAVRVPGLALPRMIAAELGFPISGVSANHHREPAPRTAADVAASLAGELDLILDAGPTPGGAPSTLIDLSGERPRLLREGILRRSALERFLAL